MSEPNAFLKLSHATVLKNGQTIFQDLDFKMLSGENWAIIASSGLEKTTFLETLLGRTSITKGNVERTFAEAYQEKQRQVGKVNSFRDLIAFVSQTYTFRNKSNVQDFYYQQRFNSADSEAAATVIDYLKEADAGIKGHWNVERVLKTMDLGPLADKSLIKLSNGETRRLAIAAALLKNPLLFLMDRPLTGLDQETRMKFGGILKTIIDSGIQVVMTTSIGEIPNSITHVGQLKHGKLFPISRTEQVEWTSIPSSQLISKELLSLLKNYPTVPYRNLIQMIGVNISYGEKMLLDNLNWEVKPGERWALKGHNGAGKSTLVSLLLGENPQAYANDFSLFDRKRGTGESIWDIKRPVGFVSPELGRYFPKNQTCLKIVLSGLFDTVGLFRKTTEAEETLAKKWLNALEIPHIAALRLAQVSLEEQRFCLLARALIKRPALLILDEAAQGMDDEQRQRFKLIVDSVCAHTPMGLVYVSHYADDIPKAVEKEIHLVQGKRVS
ncbi:ATP-binding cassette domain-containing protein [Lunatibacter salilacus]|uniref:ATP-binding cassette domain-containing protein n=1 Tax=Lunatibacter salilacus TaxID=2483804 RepID=UPI00131C8252|nr:ATP-binding cassette domain-containing protein [Lunatibacter salilacus]